MLFVFAALAAWQIGSTLVAAPGLLPSPVRVAERFVTMWSDAGFIAFALRSVWHVVAAASVERLDAGR